MVLIKFVNRYFTMGSTYLEYISRIRITIIAQYLNNKKTVIKLKTVNQNKVELNRIEEMMLQNIQSSNEQNVNSVQKVKGNYLNQVHSDQMVPQDSQVGG
jgi:hypothetical protein